MTKTTTEAAKRIGKTISLILKITENLSFYDCYVAAIIKHKGTPNLLNSSDNIDGTQTFQSQLSAVKLESIEKRGKIQTTEMTQISNLSDL